MATDLTNVDYHPWHPMNDPIDLKHLGKLLEECGELISALSRCLIQGINESEPVTAELNKDWLENEIADVIANIQLVEKRFGLIRLEGRIENKTKRLSAWHDMA
jgi:hypothetical protein